MLQWRAPCSKWGMARLVRLVLVGLLVATAPQNAAAERTPACSAWDVEYALAGTLRLTNTPFGRANGVHKVGPGTTVLRIVPGEGRVTMLSYSMAQSFTVVATAFFKTVTVVTASTTRATPDACGIAAEGVLKDGNVMWTTNVRGLRTDGTLTCHGKSCGSFGSPAPGTRPIQIGPENVRVRPFELSADYETFTMPFTLAVKTESPKQTSFLALTGREVKRTCVPAPTPCKR